MLRKAALVIGIISILAFGFAGGVATERYLITDEVGPKTVQYERPDFGPRQVRTPAEINEGDYFIKVYSHLGYGVVIKVVREPYWSVIVEEHEYGDWAIDVLRVESDGTPKELGSTGKPYYDNYFLADANVIPYPSGMWNPTNALLKIDVSELTPSTIEEIVNTFMAEFGKQE